MLFFETYGRCFTALVACDRELRSELRYKPVLDYSAMEFCNLNGQVEVF